MAEPAARNPSEPPVVDDSSPGMEKERGNDSAGVVRDGQILVRDSGAEDSPCQLGEGQNGTSHDRSFGRDVWDCTGRQEICDVCGGSGKVDLRGSFSAEVEADAGGDVRVCKDRVEEQEEEPGDINRNGFSEAGGDEKTNGDGDGDGILSSEDTAGKVDRLTECDRLELPAEIGKGVLMLRCGSAASPSGYCDIYLVGTAHVSQESCRQVQAVIRHLKPQVVFLELCESRSSMLMPQNLQVPTLKEMLDLWRNKRMNAFGILYSWFLAKVADKLEVLPGSEFRIAFEEAMACGAKITLGDRNVQITLKRTWAKMSSWHKLKLMFTLVFQAVFLPSAEELNQMMQEMDNVDMVTLLVQEMSKSFPTLMETLVHERDMFMAAMLHRVAQHCSLIVAVVGKGHLSGISKNWNTNIHFRALLEVPGKRQQWVTPFKYFGVVALAIGGLAYLSSLCFSKRT